MKRLILLLTSITIMGATSFAQVTCSKDHPIFKFENPGTPKAVTTLGANPQHPALRNLSSPQQVASAIRKHRSGELDRMLREIGFKNGAMDVTASNVTSETIAAGTTGNMGDGNNNYSYIKASSSTGWKAWKITSPEGCHVYVLAKCGNTFFPGSGVASAAVVPTCKDVAVNIVGEPREISVEQPEMRNVKTYVYFKKGCTGKTSTPILIGSRDVANGATTTAAKYRVTLDGTGTARICTDDRGNMVVTNINVEKVSGFSGFKKGAEKREYKEVSKKEYKRHLRMRSCSTACK
jgi:hypothetical protein